MFLIHLPQGAKTPHLHRKDSILLSPLRRTEVYKHDDPKPLFLLHESIRKVTYPRESWEPMVNLFSTNIPWYLTPENIRPIQMVAKCTRLMTHIHEIFLLQKRLALPEAGIRAFHVSDVITNWRVGNSYRLGSFHQYGVQNIPSQRGWTLPIFLCDPWFYPIGSKILPQFSF